MRPYYSEAGIEIYHGDCREVLSRIDDSFGCIVTSPPYNFGGFHRTSINADGTRVVREKAYGTYTDDLPPRVYRAWITSVLFDLYQVTDEGASIWWNHKGRYDDNRYESPHWVAEVSPFDFRQDIIWKYPASPDVAKNKFYPRVEHVFWMSKGKPVSFSEEMACVGNVWEITHTNGAIDHPAPFPETLATRCIMATPAGTVLDPFMGSGTTLRAAKDLGRKAIGIEMNERYCEIAAKRLAQGVLFGVPA